MRITIDPNEMGAASKVLQQCSVEVADICSQLASCVDCPMPPAVSGDVNSLIAAADVVLDRVGAALTNQAIGLVARGIIAALDSLAAASGATSLSGVGVIGGNSGPGYTITSAGGKSAQSLLGGVGVIGGNSGPGFTILNADGTPAESVLPGVGVIGGNSGLAITITSGDGSPVTSSASSLGVIGGHPSPYPAYTFSAAPSSGAGSTDLRGIEFLQPVPSIPTARGFVPRPGDPANALLISNTISAISHRTQGDINYGLYSIHETQNLREPVPRHEYPG